MNSVLRTICGIDRNGVEAKSSIQRNNTRFDKTTGGRRSDKMKECRNRSDNVISD